MDILEKTIQSLSHEEVVNYKLYAFRKEKDITRKDIVLFDLMRKSINNDANQIDYFKELYPKETNKNTYHRLKSRLLTEVDNSMAQFYFHKTDSHYIYNELELYKTYIQKNKLEIALYHLKKAETKAIESFDYPLLDIIYHEFIDLSSQYGDITPAIYIEKRNKNAILLSELRSLDDALATIIFELKRHQTFSEVNSQKVTRLQKTIEQLKKKKIFASQIGFKIKMYQAISSLLITQKDFTTLETYCISTYNDFTKQHLFTEQTHRTKLTILVHISNALYHTKKHEQALKYLDKLKLAITEFNNLYYNNYVFFYYSSLANNYSILNLLKAVEVLQEAKKTKAIQQQETLLGYIHLNLAGAYYDLKEHKTALKNILMLIQNPAFQLLDDAFKLKVNIHELILRIELQDFEYSTKLIHQLLKSFRKTLKKAEHQQDVEFLLLLDKLIVKNQWHITKKTKELLHQFLTTKHITVANSIVNYKDWLDESVVGNFK